MLVPQRRMPAGGAQGNPLLRRDGCSLPKLGSENLLFRVHSRASSISERAAYSGRGGGLGGAFDNSSSAIGRGSAGPNKNRVFPTRGDLATDSCFAIPPIVRSDV